MDKIVKIFQPSGILDGTTSPNFREEIQKLINDQAKIILIDFKDVKFMDSSGLGALILSLKNIRSAGIKLAVCSINSQIRMLFELTSMDRVFEIYENREEFNNNILSQKS